MKFINENDLRQIIDLCLERESDHSRKVQAIGEREKSLCVVLIALTGSRANEVLRLTHESIERDRVRLVDGDGVSVSAGKRESLVNWKDYKIYEVDRVRIRIKASKRGRDRLIPIDQAFHSRVKSLRERLKARGCSVAGLISDSARLKTAYINLWRFFESIQDELWGEVRYTLHSFRHTLALNALADGNHIVHIQKMLGHKSMESTYHYLRTAEDESIMNDIPMLVTPSGLGRPRDIK